MPTISQNIQETNYKKTEEARESSKQPIFL